MKGKLIDFSIGYNCKQRITIEIDSDFREGYETLKDAELEIAIKKWRKKRSNDANSYFHVIVNAIAEARGLSDDEVKRKLVVDYGVLARDEDGQIIGFKLPPGVNVDCIYPYTRLYKQVEENGKQFNCYLVYKRSSEMDTKEMARLIDGAIWEAKELGIDTDTPEERARWNSY
nr:MAG TPA: NinB protein [Caudoviricetes sp.]